MNAATEIPAAESPASALTDEHYMRLALEAARRAGLAGEPPIGACLVRNGKVLGTASNCVISELDITAHAEITLIRHACRHERSLDLSGSQLFSTVEPCPMCLAASHYARIDRIVFGATLADLQELTGNELMTLPSTCDRPTLTGGCLRRESLALLGQWARGGRR
jgi:tRNA(Arg) A34 adenosine deaminase TadA